MAWKECSVVSQRDQFVQLFLSGDSSMAAVCRQFGISRRTGYKWIGRFNSHGAAGLSDRSRRPLNSPSRVDAAVEAGVVELRRIHRAWGGRKIKRRLEDLGHSDVCSSSAITSILHRHGLIDPADSEARRHPIRFQYPAPNDLWQMDFKGHFALIGGGRCHPLTVLDDHSRYSIVLKSCDNERTETVQTHLRSAFETYGVPKRILCDNGAPWGTSGTGGWDTRTPLTLWLLRLDIKVMHGRPYHPQTQGKDERFHATLIAEVLRWHQFQDLAASQAVFDPWRETYNTQRPHEALDMRVPAALYTPSPRSFPTTLPEVVYPDSDLVRKVSGNSGINVDGRRFAIGRAFRGQNVGLRPTTVDGVWDVFYCKHRVGRIDVRNPGPMLRTADEIPAAVAVDEASPVA
jgi:transposase InsO family protein